MGSEEDHTNCRLDFVLGYLYILGPFIIPTIEEHLAMLLTIFAAKPAEIPTHCFKLSAQLQNAPERDHLPLAPDAISPSPTGAGCVYVCV
jgi:hypothetical protein